MVIETIKHIVYCFCLWYGCSSSGIVSLPESDPIMEREWVRVEEIEETVEETVDNPEPVELAADTQSYSEGVEQWRPLVAGHFNPADVDRVLCLMGFESGGDPNARNGSSGASGLLQVMPFWADEYGVSKADLFTPEINLFIARKIRDVQGWGAWSPYKRGECR